MSHIKALKAKKQNEKLYDFIGLLADKLMEQCIISPSDTGTYPMIFNQENITRETIKLFHTISSKADNDAHNKLREETICACLNNKIPSEWKTDIQWAELDTQVKEFVNKLVESPIKSIKAEKKSGRKFNYDIHLKVEIEKGQEKEKEFKTEFKYNSENITKYPEFISIASNKFINNSEEYASYFYDNYLPKIVELYKGIAEDITIPLKHDYLKYIYNSNYSKLKLFETMYTHEESVIEKKKEIVDKSIESYLSKFILDISALNEKLMESQSGKVFMLYKSGKFHYDMITDNELTVTTIKEIKNKNTVVCATKNPTSFIHMLLRWKNHAGILFPAWQIKLVRGN
jgi:hypothetical protein